MRGWAGIPLKTLFLSALALAWTATVPKLSNHAYRGPMGWHDTIPDGTIDISRDQLNEAISMCWKHHWWGYIQWQSPIGREVDSCQFMKKVDE